MSLASRISKIEPSGTVEFTSLIDRLRKEGRQIINFAVGEPEFVTPSAVVAATQKALGEGKTRYGDVKGLMALRRGVAEQYSGCNANRIIITNGSKQALYNSFQVLLNPGDEVIIPRPYWVSFVEQVKLAGGRPVLVDTSDFQLDLNRMEAAVSERTRAILINSPNNPTGAVYPLEALKGVAQIAAKHNLFVISDEAYDHFVYDGNRHISFFEIEEIRDRLILTGSFSKTFSMTGFRIGYVLAPEEISLAIAKLQGHLTGNVCSFAQYGALAAMNVGDQLLESQRSDLEHKRDVALELIGETFDCVRPQGAFYLFPDVSSCLQKGETSDQFSARILQDAGVAVVPGVAFGWEGHVRISYALSEEILIEGIKRMVEVL